MPGTAGVLLAAVVLTACAAPDPRPGAAHASRSPLRPTPSPTARPVSTDRSVGALLVRSPAGATTQLCTASVVDSPAGDVVATAAHCVGPGRRLVFAPGYRDGRAPLGTWTVLTWHTDAAWQDHADVDADYAFLTLAPSGGRSVESVTGGIPLGSAPVAGDEVTVVGYPTALHGRRLTCAARVRATREFPTVDCLAFSGGTSGGPLLRRDPRTGSTTLVGVIGGLETGGCTPDVSYASPFTAETRAVFEAAQRHGPSSPPPRTAPAASC